MDPRIGRLPSAPPGAGLLVLWQGLIGALGTLAADCDRLWRQRRRVLDTLPVMLFVFRLVFAPRRHGYPTALAELWPRYRALVGPLPLPVSDTAPSQARLKLDENGFQPFHAETLRRDAPSGPPGLLSPGSSCRPGCRSTAISSRTAANVGRRGLSIRRASRCASVCVSASPSSPFAPAPPVPATLLAPGLEMGSMPTPPEGAMDVTGPLVSGKNTRIHTQNL